MTESSIAQGKTQLPAKSELYGLISSDVRLHLLDILADSTVPLDPLDLARAIVARSEGDGPVEDAVEIIAVELYHNHLPRLNEFGLIYYDLDSNQIVAIHPAVSERNLGVPTAVKQQ